MSGAWCRQLVRALVVSGATAAVLALPAEAADLGPSCCSDLEERVAELEATAVRKGNRKVSLSISGFVAEQIMFWDDGVESNTYVLGTGPTQATNVRFSGEATIAPGWTASYLLRIQDLHDNSFGANQHRQFVNSGLNDQVSSWSLAGNDFGKVTVGKQALAGKSAAMFTDLSGTQIIASYVLFDGAGFFLRSNGVLTSVTWGDLGFCYSQAVPLGGDCDGLVMNGVRYDTPSFAGFTASASWGEDEDWEVALRYGGEVSGFKLAAGAAYSVNTTENTQPPTPPFAGFDVKDSSYVQIGGYAEHLVSGLFVHAAYGREDNGDTILIGGTVPQDGHQWYVKGGLRRSWHPLGKTIVWGEYADYLDQLGPAALATGATGSEFVRWGGGIAQELDAAAMVLWLKYRRYEGELEGGTIGPIDDADFFHTGALINF